MKLREGRKPLKARFQSIYAEHRWSGGGSETRSGAGSTLEATASIRKSLPGLIRELDVSGLLDIGCGDFNWMKEIDLPTHYLGVDIVPEVIEANKARYGTENIDFVCLDACSAPIPSGYEMILCREVLFHLSFNDGLSIIDGIKESGATWLLTTTAPGRTDNKEIVSGGFRNIDLQKKPYCFPAPRRMLKDDAVSANRNLGFWLVKDL